MKTAVTKADREWAARNMVVMLDRKAIALNSLIEVIGEMAGLSDADAALVANAYIAHKLVRLDAVDSRFYVKHGGMLDSDTILNTLDNIKAGHTCRTCKA